MSSEFGWRARATRNSVSLTNGYLTNSFFGFLGRPADPIQEESSILEPEPQEVNGTFNLEFEIVDESSKRGRPKVVDNRRERGNYRLAMYSQVEDI